MRGVLLFTMLTLAAAGQTFPLAGVVVDAGTRTPMGRVRITLTPAARPTDQRAMVTAADGKFSFDVPKGKFSISAEYRGFRQPFGQSGPATGFGVSIFTGPDQDTSQLVFRWFAPGAISGKVIDDRAEPVENALVQLIRVAVVGGRNRRSTVAWARTNDLGEYRFGQRAGGAYYLVVTGEPWYTARSQPIRIPGQEPAQGDPAQSYLPVYYPNANDPAGARALELAPGAEVTADFRLLVTAGVNVHVHCPHPAGQSTLISLLTDGAAGVDAYQRQAWMMGNDQTIAGVLPGRYVVLVDGRNGYTSSARKTIDVGTSDVSVDLTIEPAPTVSGTVTFKDPDRKPRRTIYVRLIDESTGTVLAQPVDSSGAFSFSSVTPSRRRVLLVGADGFFAAEITAEGAAITGPVIEVTPGASIKLTITATDEIGTLKGSVMNGDRPVPGVLVVLAPKNESKDPGAYRGFQTDSDGSFDFQNVRAGDYILFAIERLDLAYAEAAAVRPYLASGKPVHIAPHAALVENATLSTLVPQ